MENINWINIKWGDFQNLFRSIVLETFRALGCSGSVQAILVNFDSLDVRQRQGESHSVRFCQFEGMHYKRSKIIYMCVCAYLIIMRATLCKNTRCHFKKNESEVFVVRRHSKIICS